MLLLENPLENKLNKPVAEEKLLQRISEYIHQNQLIIDSFEEGHRALSNDSPDLVQLNSFAFLSIKNEFVKMTYDCEDLLSTGIQCITNYPQHEKSVELLLFQLRELQTYSMQIEGALHEFEEKLLRMEEVLAEHSLWN